MAVDCMGGDHGPHVTVPAALEFRRAHPDVNIVLVGLRESIEAELRSRHLGSNASRLARGVRCDLCGKVRRGKEWITTKSDEHCLLGTCPDCERKPTRRPAKRNRSLKELVIEDLLEK